MNRAFANTWTIAKRELKGYFNSPVAYVFIVIFLALLAGLTFYLGGFFEIGQAALGRPFFQWHPWLYLVLIPAIGMRLWAEERRMGTLELLMTMPITTWQAILGKFLAAWFFLALVLVLTFPVVISVNYLGDPDNGVIFCTYVGSWLMAGAYLAITGMTSAMTRNQIISFIISLVICFALFLCGYSPVLEAFKPLLSPKMMYLIDLISACSVTTHFASFQRGLLDSRDIIFFLSLIGFSLFTTSVILRNHRA